MIKHYTSITFFSNFPITNYVYFNGAGSNKGPAPLKGGLLGPAHKSVADLERNESEFTGQKKNGS